jgi:hypothetical protein
VSTVVFRDGANVASPKKLAVTRSLPTGAVEAVHVAMSPVKFDTQTNVPPMVNSTVPEGVPPVADTHAENETG